MKIAIHHRENSFSDYWIKYCEKNQLNYILVDCYATDIIQQLKGCHALLWNWVHWNSRDVLFARQLIFSLEQMGMQIFPNFRTCLFFDDKLGQKYLFESLNIPAIKSYAFYNKKDAIRWIENKGLPLVFKLRGGAGSVNVKLVKTKRQGMNYIKKSFSGGFNSMDLRISNFKDRIYKYKQNNSLKTFTHVLKGLVRFFYGTEHIKLMKPERGYVYFQDFIPNNNYDIRVAVIGKKAVALKRMVRENDFRASGSGNFIFCSEEIPDECVRMAFDINDRLRMQSVAFDFIKHDGEFKVVEISYNFVHLKWPGYWNRKGQYIKDDNFRVADFMIEDLLERVRELTKVDAV